MTLTVSAFAIAFWSSIAAILLGIVLGATSRSGAFGMPDESGCAGALLGLIGAAVAAGLLIGRALS